MCKAAHGTNAHLILLRQCLCVKQPGGNTHFDTLLRPVYQLRSPVELSIFICYLDVLLC